MEGGAPRVLRQEEAETLPPRGGGGQGRGVPGPLAMQRWAGTAARSAAASGSLWREPGYAEDSSCRSNKHFLERRGGSSRKSGEQEPGEEIVASHSEGRWPRLSSLLILSSTWG